MTFDEIKEVYEFLLLIFPFCLPFYCLSYTMMGFTSVGYFLFLIIVSLLHMSPLLKGLPVIDLFMIWLWQSTSYCKVYTCVLPFFRTSPSYIRMWVAF